MRGSIFNRTTGAFMFYGDLSDRKPDALIRAGHKAVEGVNGGGPDWLKYDFAAGEVVADESRRQQARDQVEQRKNAVVRRREIQAELATLAGSHTPTDINTQIDLLNEFARLS